MYQSLTQIQEKYLPNTLSDEKDGHMHVLVLDRFTSVLYNNGEIHLFIHMHSILMPAIFQQKMMSPYQKIVLQISQLDDIKKRLVPGDPTVKRLVELYKKLEDAAKEGSAIKS